MRFVKFLALLIALLASFAAGAITAGMRHWLQPIATVQIRNLSALDASSLVLTSRTANSTTTVDLGTLAAGKEVTARLIMAGEGSYQIRATLSDGRVLTGGAGYVESGYSTTELLRHDKIESRSRFGY